VLTYYQNETAILIKLLLSPLIINISLKLNQQNSSPLLASGAPIRQHIHLSLMTRERVMNTTENETYKHYAATFVYTFPQKTTIIQSPKNKLVSAISDKSSYLCRIYNSQNNQLFAITSI